MYRSGLVDTLVTKQELAKRVTPLIIYDQFGIIQNLQTSPYSPSLFLAVSYSKTALDDKNKFGNLTPLMSNPRAATAVATKIGILPVLKSRKASSLSRWRRSP
jgi:hypothetical protein